MTIAEKLLAAHAGKSQVTPGEYVWAKVDAASGHALRRLGAMGIGEVWNSDIVVSGLSRPARSHHKDRLRIDFVGLQPARGDEGWRRSWKT